eukprot:193083-Rhodomonas_salina.5
MKERCPTLKINKRGKEQGRQSREKEEETARRKNSKYKWTLLVQMDVTLCRNSYMSGPAVLLTAVNFYGTNGV